jgi:SAM-dependent methyltransferase
MGENGSAAYRGRVKYDEATARQYQVRKRSKHAAEMRLVERAFALVPKSHRVLDAPCGGGRVTLHLAQAGYAMSAADLSEAMIALTRAAVAQHGLAVPVEKQDLERLTFGDRSFDTIISFRLFHHFPTPAIRQRVVSELCRVARKYVALSYFSPASVTSVKRSLRAALGGRKSEKHATSLGEVAGYFAQAGFTLARDFAQLPLIHTLHIALFERVGETAP